MNSTTGRRSSAARRFRQHLALMAISAALVALVYVAVRSDDIIFRVSMATAYASLLLLVYGLVLGPMNVLAGRPNPVSTNLRRDVGIWAGILGLLHVLVGVQVHLRGRMLEYFYDPRSRHVVPVRVDAFGAANYSGLLAGLILVLLLAISNDVTLGRLGTRRWKTLQRTNYIGMALIVGHSALYQFIEKRHLPFIIFFALSIGTCLAWQLVGYRRVKSREAAPQS